MNRRCEWKGEGKKRRVSEGGESGEVWRRGGRKERWTGRRKEKEEKSAKTTKEELTTENENKKK